MYFIRVAAAALLLIGLLHQVSGHSRMLDPKPVFPSGFQLLSDYYGVIFSRELVSKLGEVDNSKGVENIARVMKAENSPSLRQFIVDHINLLELDDGNKTSSGTGKIFTPTPECGFTLTTGRRQPLPDVISFPWFHPGPCEIWCDNVRLLSNPDCRANVGRHVKVDKSKCAGASLLQGMYVGVHTPRWQVFGNCVALDGGTGTDPKKVFNYRGNSSGGDTDGASDDDVPPTRKPKEVPSATPSAKCLTMRD